jgi:hypothetical protein
MYLQHTKQSVKAQIIMQKNTTAAHTYEKAQKLDKAQHSIQEMILFGILSNNIIVII